MDKKESQSDGLNNCLFQYRGIHFFLIQINLEQLEKSEDIIEILFSLPIFHINRSLTDELVGFTHIDKYVWALKHTWLIFLPSYKTSLHPPELPWVHSFHPIEETSEGGDLGKMEAIGDLCDAHRGLTQQERGLHQQHLVDVVDNSTAS